MKIPIKTKPVWKLPKGHPIHLSGAGEMQDKRTKRNRTRQTRNTSAIKEQNDDATH